MCEYSWQVKQNPHTKLTYCRSGNFIIIVYVFVYFCGLCKPWEYFYKEIFLIYCIQFIWLCVYKYYRQYTVFMHHDLGGGRLAHTYPNHLRISHKCLGSCRELCLIIPPSASSYWPSLFYLFRTNLFRCGMWWLTSLSLSLPFLLLPSPPFCFLPSFPFPSPLSHLRSFLSWRWYQVGIVARGTVVQSTYM